MQTPKAVESSYESLRLILGDQLNAKHSWFGAEPDSSVVYVMMEMRQETDYAPHHVQKVLGFFGAMRRFAGKLTKQGHSVHYVCLDDPDNAQSLTDNLARLLKQWDCQAFAWQQPDEYRLDQQLQQFAQTLSIRTECVSTEHFLTTPQEFAKLFKGKKGYLMETFYRHVRKQFGYLMKEGKPIGDKWNYDAENRKKLPDKQEVVAPKLWAHDLSEIETMIRQHGVRTIGRVDARQFAWPLNRQESLALLDFFLTHCLADFGKYQDALTDRYWSVYHSRLSFSLNTKMLSPAEVTEKAIAHWEANQAEISLAQIEGFIRQIIGWREYMRAIYWLKMPEYAELNFFEHTRPLPAFFWTGQTQMRCLAHSIGQSLEYAYAHHIQRLMVTGNFALLAQIAPDAVDEWYLGIYIDAIEWVEITNTRGMSQFADGGIVGTKPYISSGNYISKMGNYCSKCPYDVKKRTGENACPFNSLYWNFLDTHREKLGRNPRMGNMYRVWDKMSNQDQTDTLKQAADYLEKIESL